MEAAGSGHVAASMKKTYSILQNEEAAVLQGYSPLQGSRFRLLGMNEYLHIPCAWIVSELVEINRENAQFSL
jgi:hypothetical protein